MCIILDFNTYGTPSSGPLELRTRMTIMFIICDHAKIWPIFLLYWTKLLGLTVTQQL